jgi:hypothetical protein
MVTLLPNQDIQSLIEELKHLQEALPEQARVLKSLLDQIARQEKTASKKPLNPQQYARAKERLGSLVSQLRAMALQLEKHPETVKFLEWRGK